MSITTGCVCSKCKKWHSHITKEGDKYICIECNHKKEVEVNARK